MVTDWSGFSSFSSCLRSIERKRRKETKNRDGKEEEKEWFLRLRHSQNKKYEG